MWDGLFVLDPCQRWHARLSAYIVREHERGRQLAEILTDRFVVEHASEAAITHLLTDPPLMRRLADGCRQFPSLGGTRAVRDRAKSHASEEAEQPNTRRGRRPPLMNAGRGAPQPPAFGA
jgi:hypothetical protein